MRQPYRNTVRINYNNSTTATASTILNNFTVTSNGATLYVTNTGFAGTYTSPTVTGTDDDAFSLDYGNSITETVREPTRKELLARLFDGSKIQVPEGHRFVLEMPDGSALHFDGQNYRIDDANAKVVYKANYRREFNTYINASDMLAKFVDYLNTLKVKRSEVMSLPIELFIQWLVIEAAKADDELIPDDEVTSLRKMIGQNITYDPKLPPEVKAVMLPPPTPRCGCGRFLSPSLHKRGLLFCNGDHMDKYAEKVLARTP